MKRIYLYILLSLLMLTACNQTLEEGVEYEAIKSELEVSVSELDLQWEAQSQDIRITCNSYWVAETKTSWLSLSPKNGKGNGSLQVVVGANSSGTTQRSGVIEITDGIRTIQVNVNQRPQIDESNDKPEEGDNPTPEY